MVSRIKQPAPQPASASAVIWCLFAQQGQQPLERLDPVSRTKVVMALLALVLLAVAFLTCVWLLGRWARRMVRRDPPRRQPIQDRVRSDWDPPQKPQS